MTSLVLKGSAILVEMVEMSSSQLLLEDCGTFVRINGQRIPKDHVYEWGLTSGGDFYLSTVSGYQTFFESSVVVKDLAAFLDEAMRGA